MSINPYSAPSGPGERIDSPSLQAQLFSLSATSCPADFPLISLLTRKVLWRFLSRSVLQITIVTAYFFGIYWMIGRRIPGVSYMMLVVVFLYLQCALVIMLLRFWQQRRQVSKIPTVFPKHSVQLVGFAHGLHWIAAGCEQFSAWPTVKSLTPIGDRMIVMAPSLMHRSALVLEDFRLEGPFRLEKLPQIVASLVLQGSRNFNTNELMKPHPFDSVYFDCPQSLFSGTVRSSHVANQDRVDWWINGGILLWLCLTLLMFLFYCATSLALASMNKGDPQNFIGVLLRILLMVVVLWIFFRIRRQLARFFVLYFFKNACISRYELWVSEQGFEMRTNGSHVRARWTMFCNPEIESGTLSAEFCFSDSRTNILNRELLANDSDWIQVSSMAMRSIPRSDPGTSP